MRAVLDWLRAGDLHTEPIKCTFFCDSVPFTGKIIYERGTHSSEENLRALRDMRSPTNVHELRSFNKLLFKSTFQISNFVVLAYINLQRKMQNGFR